MTHPDDRPRPQYGEYASPQEQRAHIQEPPPTPPESVPATPVAPAAAPAVAPAPRRPSVADRVVTISLLVYGAINVILAAPSFLNLSQLATTTLRMMGVQGRFTDTPAAHAWGVAAVVVLVVGFLLTAALSLRALRRGRRAWWIPLAGAVVTYAAVSICVSVPLAGDPAFLGYLHAH